MSDTTQAAVSSPATDTTGGSVTPAANPGTGYTPSGNSFFRHMAPSPSGEVAREAARADLAAARGIAPGVASPDANSGGQALSPDTAANDRTATPGDTSGTPAPPADATTGAPQTEADRLTTAVENDDVSTLPLHLQERGKQLIEQKNRYKTDAETANARLSKWQKEIDRLEGLGYADASAVEAYHAQEQAKAEADRLATEDAEFHAARVAELEDGDAFLTAEQAERIAEREVEIRRREREADDKTREATDFLRTASEQQRMRQYDTVLTATVEALPVLRDFANDPTTGKGLFQMILEDLAINGTYTPEQVANIGRRLAEKASAALQSQENQVAARYAADLANKQAAAPPSLGSGGTPPATGAPTNYKPTGSNFAVHLTQPRRTM